jgi:methionyl-tRNA formyltransferase
MASIPAMPAMQLIFIGSGDFGLPTLQSLNARHQVRAVVTQPDRPAGRKRRLTPTPIAAWAQAENLHVIKTDNISAADMVAQLGQLSGDAAVVVAFGQKLSTAVIDALAPLVVNLHGSLLPRLRGAAPINWAIINAQAETGLTVISLAQKMDAGLIYAQQATPIDPLETAGELHDRLATMGPELILNVLDNWQAGKLEGQPQDEAQSTAAPKLSAADAWVDFAATAHCVRDRIHGLTPWPGVRVIWRRANGREAPLAIHRVGVEPQHHHAQPPGTILPGLLVAVGHAEDSGAIKLLDVQPPGKRVMSIKAFASGHPLSPGDLLVSRPATGQPRD